MWINVHFVWSIDVHSTLSLIFWQLVCPNSANCPSKSIEVSVAYEAVTLHLLCGPFAAPHGGFVLAQEPTLEDSVDSFSLEPWEAGPVFIPEAEEKALSQFLPDCCVAHTSFPQQLGTFFPFPSPISLRFSFDFLLFHIFLKKVYIIISIPPFPLFEPSCPSVFFCYGIRKEQLILKWPFPKSVCTVTPNSFLHMGTIFLPLLGRKSSSGLLCPLCLFHKASQEKSGCKTQLL